MTNTVETPKDNTGFAAGTLVHTKGGLKRIEDICIGDWVLSYPENASIPVRERAPFRLEDEYIYKQVTQIFIHNDKEIVHITYIQPGGEKIVESLHATPNHPFYVKRRGWIPTVELKIGNVLETAGFGNLMVTKVKQTGETARVYNIEVDEYHTYYVEKLGVWVHNK